MSHNLSVSLLVLAGILTATSSGKSWGTDPPPNFVVIVADDLGYGDLGCYGSQINQTPHLDRLASEGMRFTDFHSNGPMCTPTRVALLTGLYQQRFGRKFDGPLSGKTQREEGLPLHAVTIAEVLKDAGYATGMFGKWHLGYQAPHLPTRQGFDEFRGLVSGDGDHHSHIDRSGNEDWWHNEQVVMENGYTADLLTRHSVEYIERHKDEPFFLYVPHLAIHFPWQGPDDPSHRVQGQDYWNDKWGRIRDPNNVSPHVRSMVEALDRSVGEILAKLQKLDLEKRTLVFVLSDNGGYRSYGNSHHNISSNGTLRGQKGQVFEGGHRVPAIAWWPGQIRPGVCQQTAMTFDLFPTLLHFARVQADVAVQLDGVNLSSVLREQASLAPRTLFWRMGDSRAVRRGSWKLVTENGQRPMLFDLDQDLAENNDLASKQPDIVRQLNAAYANWEQQVTTSCGPE